jgi:hypothetical protein
VNLLEATVATAIAATVTGATLGAVVNAAHAAAGDPVRDALQSTAAREARVAMDVLKYDGASIVPRAIATTIPLPAGTPFAAELSIAIAPQPNGATGVTVTATSLASEGERAAVAESLDSRSPLPGARAKAPGLAPAPTGAP